MIWATLSSQSCFCWLYRASPSLTAKNIINLISVLNIWWCPCPCPSPSPAHCISQWVWHHNRHPPPPKKRGMLREYHFWQCRMFSFLKDIPCQGPSLVSPLHFFHSQDWKGFLISIKFWTWMKPNANLILDTHFRKGSSQRSSGVERRGSKGFPTDWKRERCDPKGLEQRSRAHRGTENWVE